MKKETLLEMLRRHEGLQNYPYTCDGGKLTIGYGRNLEDVGISDDEAVILLICDMERALSDIQDLFPNFEKLSRARKDALTDMIFNLGRAGFLTFRKMIAGILDEDWKTVADEAKDSKWYRQVGVRGVEIVAMLRNG